MISTLEAARWVSAHGPCPFREQVAHSTPLSTLPRNQWYRELWPLEDPHEVMLDSQERVWCRSGTTTFLLDEPAESIRIPNTERLNGPAFRH